MKMFLIASMVVSGLVVTATAKEEKGPAVRPTTQPTTQATQPTEVKMDPLTRVRIETTLGDIVLELNAEKAPITVENFLRYADSGFYEGTVFHRVMPTFMIQGGGFTPDIKQKSKGLFPPIKIESDNGLGNVAGTITMARTGNPNSATSQFFISVADNSRMLNYRNNRSPGYTVFGKVVDGMDVVEKIRHTKTHVHPNYRTPDGAVTPVEPMIIKAVRRVEQSKPKAGQPKTDKPAADKKADD